MLLNCLNFNMVKALRGARLCLRGSYRLDQLLEEKIKPNDEDFPLSLI